MTTSPGDRLGPYEIVSPLGKGGMGEVWRAHDARLARDVALKILPDDFAADPERIARFEREAKVLASLNHPNVAALYGVEHVDGRHVLVMELAEGEGLDAVIARGAVPLDEAIEIASGIASGLEAAHQKGVVHRDLKPANVMLGPDGRVKVLDFGLARAYLGDEGAESDLGNSPTLTAAMTREGVVLGTAAYMSPEQARGRKVDRRADMWAFGVVLWELLTGSRMFVGETASDVMAGVLRADIDLDALPDGTPAAVRRLLRRCLERDPRRRLRDAGDAVLELSDAMRADSEPGGDAAQGEPQARTGRIRRAPLLSALALAALATAVAVWALVRPDVAPAPARTHVSFERRTFDEEVIFNARFLPEGQGIVYSAARSGNAPELFLLPNGAVSPKLLAGKGTHLLSVSSEGELAVLTGATFATHRIQIGTLARMSVDGYPRPLVEQVSDADWGPDESLAIVRMEEGGNRLEYPIGTVLYETTGYVSEPRVSADGTRVAFLDHQWPGDDRGRLKIVDRSGKVTTLSREYWAIEGLAWSADGATLIFSGALDEPRLQPRAVTPEGERTEPLLEVPGEFFVVDIDHDGNWLALEEDNRYGVVAHPSGGPDVDLTWLDSSWGPHLAPDERTLLFSNGRGGTNYDVVTRRLDGSPIATLGEGNALGFSPDGRWVAAQIAEPPAIALYPTGAGSPRRLERDSIDQYRNAQWFPDSEHVLVSGNEAGRPVRAFRQSIDGGPPEPVTPEGVDGMLSPDGTTIIARDVDGGGRLYPVDGGAPRAIVGLQADDDVAAWSPDGKAVCVYRKGQVPVNVERIDLATGRRTPVLTITPQQRAGLVRIWFTAPVFDPDGGYAYSYRRTFTKMFVVKGGGT